MSLGFKKGDSTKLQFLDEEGNPELTRTKQSMKDECDVNLIMKSWNYGDGKPITHVNEKAPNFGDFSEVSDYATAKLRVADADLAFAELPSDLRKEMDNDPAKLLEYIEDANNFQAAVEMGLLDLDDRPGEPEPSPPAVEIPTETPEPGE